MENNSRSHPGPTPSPGQSAGQGTENTQPTTPNTPDMNNQPTGNAPQPTPAASHTTQGPAFGGPTAGPGGGMPPVSPGAGYGTGYAPPPYGYSPALSSGGMPPPYGAAQRPRTNRPSTRKTSPLVIVIAVAMTLVILVWAIAMVSLVATIGSLFRVTTYDNNPPNGTFSVVTVVGTIQSAGSDAFGISDPSYHHAETLNHIKMLAEDGGNAGILLYMNTPGGTVYEGDELYEALMAYKKATGRPVWAYMYQTCASAGYYICAAADHIVAGRNTTTGSIGVYIALSDTSGLYEKLGIETVLVRSGDNKGVGTEGVPITEDNRAIYQSIVDETYSRFVEIVAQGRNMSMPAVMALADGRPYSGTQALNNGLVDELADWETTLLNFEQETGAAAFYTSFSRTSSIAQIIQNMADALPQNETQTLLQAAEALPTGVPLSYYNPAYTG